MESISIVVPCYNEEKALPYFWRELHSVMERMPGIAFEVIFVDDGSVDATAKEIMALAGADARVKYISFSRNFGKEAAILAGFEHARGDYVAMMDADLQDPPSLLPELYHAVAAEGFDSAATRRVSRKGEPPVRSFFARLFYKIIHRMTDVEIVDGARDFRLMNRAFLNALLALKERNRFSKGLFGWVGFKTKWIEFENVERVAGTTKWSFWKLFKYSIEGLVAFTTVPLVVSSFAGFLLCVLSIAATVFIAVRKLMFGDPVSGWASTVCIITFLNGAQMFFLGILGQYMAKLYTEVKNRPIYIISDTNIEVNT